MKGGLKELEMAAGFECTCNHPQLTLFFFFPSTNAHLTKVIIAFMTTTMTALTIRRIDTVFFYSKRKLNSKLNDPQVHNHSIQRPVSRDCRLLSLAVSQVDSLPVFRT